jgi:hypothetical protein
MAVRRFGLLFGIAFAAAEAAAAGITYGVGAPLFPGVTAECGFMIMLGVFLSARSATRRSPVKLTAAAADDRSASVVNRFAHVTSWCQAFVIFGITLNIAVTGGAPAYKGLIVSLAMAVILPTYHEVMLASPACGRSWQLAFAAVEAIVGLGQLVTGVFIPVAGIFVPDPLACLKAGNCLTLSVRTHVAVALSSGISGYAAYSYFR